MKTVVAFGNPLLDTTIFVTDCFLLNKYNLKEDDQKEITKNEMYNICNDILSYKKYESAGGCAQNSLRVLQWLLKKKCKTFIFGTAGKDADAITLKNLLEKDGVQTRYIEQEDLPTGKTVAIVKSPYRSLVAYLGAAEKLLLSDILNHKDFSSLILESHFVYIEGFFLTKRTETAKYILDYCNKYKKTVIFNISGEYVCNSYPDIVKYFVENSDIVFGNKREFQALAQIMHTTVIELTTHWIENGRDKLELYGKIIVITDGPRMGMCIYKGKTVTFDVPLIDKKDVVDTTSAGDAFVGGFIAGLCTNKSLEDCAEIACSAALHIIQQTGCTLPDYESDILNEFKHF